MDLVVGDVSGDGELNVLDVISLINIVLSDKDPTETQIFVADVDGNGTVNVLDAISLVNIIFS